MPGVQKSGQVWVRTPFKSKIGKHPQNQPNPPSVCQEFWSHTITTWRVFKNAGTSGAGTSVSLQCQVTYSKHAATESFTLFKGVSDSGYKIVGHNVNSTALLTE
jgi:hypothetical protein